MSTQPTDPPPRWRPPAAKTWTAFRGEPRPFKPRFMVRLSDITRARRRAFGSCLGCGRFAPIHPYYLNFMPSGRAWDPSTSAMLLEKRLRCSACGNGHANSISVEARPDEPFSPPEYGRRMTERRDDGA